MRRAILDAEVRVREDDLVEAAKGFEARRVDAVEDRGAGLRELRERKRRVLVRAPHVVEGVEARRREVDLRQRELQRQREGEVALADEEDLAGRLCHGCGHGFAVMAVMALA